MQKKRTITGLHVKEEEKDSDYQKIVSTSFFFLIIGGVNVDFIAVGKTETHTSFT